MSFSRANSGTLSGYFQSLSLVGSTAIAGSGYNGTSSGGGGNGIWYSSNSGSSWTQSNITTNVWNAVSLEENI